jgi:cellulose biosynthesis protein BcsQ
MRKAARLRRQLRVVVVADDVCRDADERRIAEQRQRTLDAAAGFERLFALVAVADANAPARPVAERIVVDSAAGIRAGEVGEYLDEVDAVIVPILPSAIDLEAAEPFLAEVAALSPIKRGKVPVALVANRLKPWTNASQQAIDTIKRFPFPIVAELRDTQGYVLASELGKSIFDYNSEVVRSHQDDWSKLLRWLKKLA